LEAERSRDDAGRSLHGLERTPDGPRREGHRKVGGRGAQHEPADAVGVPAPDQLGDRAAHRVADEDRPAHVEDVEQRNRVIGAILQRERIVGADPASVSAMVEGDHPVALAKGRDRRSPVEGAGRRPAVEQDDHGRLGRRAGLVAGEGDPAAR
jgi:hypothetical protein